MKVDNHEFKEEMKENFKGFKDDMNNKIDHLEIDNKETRNDFKTIKENDLKHIEKDISRINGIFIIMGPIIVAIFAMVLK
jgi:hypothetical protein